ncbi:carboxyvinyl-carboxyphosphonate phosphorylmutase [Rhodovulum sulfidophilum]|uniref:Isocitrate lyase/PEP mutase family protein n=1 Tax=Rhodovulum visakhapatnamense TaxID=364297 RepID=A0ABS1RDU1_9RHOB|nr:isocitrate lyase/PEP mutase family protein [Rhodovulum visakhapatnamense]MBL3569992.1 isocitrate lyase/PEP mutase family protein [Rhodovulum visakhapatnamense]MBL3577811.1 isocitrate lyase/PEP mutase family protein [Rhodovulum visakhapatnamense]OLS42355.1 carboxyvinyl-carboxyphosphonate phosphorylmutase [Rhodovulum sulfidophilum]
MLNHDVNRGFRNRIAQGGALLLPGAANALAARIIEDLGFEAVYLSGAGLTNTYLGMPDLAFVSLPEIAQHTATIRDATDLPIVVDADNGFGNALNVRHTIRTLERAGASAIQLEDQKTPKRCGHFSGKEVVPLAEARSRIKAAVDARQDANTLIVARTDARATDGYTEALDRAAAFVEDGADITFVEAPQSAEELAGIPRALPGTPQIVNLVVGGKTPILDLTELDGMGFKLVLYANVALQSAVYGMQAALGQLRDQGRMDESGPLAGFLERQRVVRKDFFDDLEKHYAF